MTDYELLNEILDNDQKAIEEILNDTEFLNARFENIEDISEVY